MQIPSEVNPADKKPKRKYTEYFKFSCAANFWSSVNMESNKIMCIDFSSDEKAKYEIFVAKSIHGVFLFVKMSFCEREAGFD